MAEQHRGELCLSLPPDRERQRGADHAAGEVPQGADWGCQGNPGTAPRSWAGPGRLQEGLGQGGGSVLLWDGHRGDPAPGKGLSHEFTPTK